MLYLRMSLWSCICTAPCGSRLTIYGIQPCFAIIGLYELFQGPSYPSERERKLLQVYVLPATVGLSTYSQLVHLHTLTRECMAKHRAAQRGFSTPTNTHSSHTDMKIRDGLTCSFFQDSWDWSQGIYTPSLWIHKHTS